jgi:GWxTD domain-containing protein
VLAVALSLLALTGRAFGQYPNPGPASQPSRPAPGTSLSRPHFSADAAIQPGEGGAPEVRIDYRLPRAELLFERTPTGFKAAYQVRAIFRSTKKNRQVAGDEFSREMKVATYPETNAQGLDILDHVTLRVPAGKYIIEVDITDLNAEATSSTSLEFEVPSTPASQLWFTDITLGTLVPDSASASASAGAFDPNPSRHYGVNITRLAATFEIVDNRGQASPDSTYRLHYQVLSDLPQPSANGDTAVTRLGARTPVVIRPAMGAVEAGSYRFVVELKSPLPPPVGGKKSQPIHREKTFTVEPSSATLWADPHGTIDVLRYIASDQENDEMNSLRTPEQQREFWEDFWKRRDPSPGTPENEKMDEFYKRVTYANQHFTAGTQGWRTDMGRIYIKYGQPDEVVRNPFRFEGPPEEIWYFYRARYTFFFVDRDGFGRYELDESRSTKTD